MRRVTIKDIAQATGVSANTVSRALNNKAEIRKQTKERILSKADELGYRPNRLARGLRSSKTGTIGVIVTDLGNPYFAALVKSVEAIARDHDYSIILQDTDEDYDREQEAIEVLLAEQVDGLIISPVQTKAGTIERLHKTRVPFVLLGRYFKELNTDYVVPDDLGGGVAATEHLARCGYRSIAFINGPLHISSAAERFEGFKSALEDFNIEINHELISHGAITVSDGYELGNSLLNRAVLPDAILCYSDFVAFGVMRALREAGMKVPDEVGVMGFDDVELASCLSLPLTTVRCPKQGLGEEAMTILAQRLTEGARDAPYQKKLPMKLIARQTTNHTS